LLEPFQIQPFLVGEFSAERPFRIDKNFRLLTCASRWKSNCISSLHSPGNDALDRTIPQSLLLRADEVIQ